MLFVLKKGVVIEMWYGTTQQPGTTEMKRIASHHTRGVLDLFAQTHPTKRYANPITKGRSLFLFSWYTREG